MSDYLPDDVLANIFFRLPAKTVLDCRCVCKFWRSVISNSSFLCDYNYRSFNNKNNTRLILSRYDDTRKREEIMTLHNDDESFAEHFEEFEFPFDHGLSNYLLIGFSCGLVCFLESSKAENFTKSILIWNPSVGYSFKTFPIEPPVSKIFRPYSANGPYVQSSEGKPLVSCFAFGFDPRSFDYKVVRIVYNCLYSKRSIEIVDVFALSTGNWQNITASAPPYVIKESSVTAYVNGAIHWIGYYDASHVERLVSQLIIAVFDLHDEVFKELKLPSEMMKEAIEIGHDDRQKISIGVIRNSLALLHYHSNSRNAMSIFYGCSVWVMNEYGAMESWTRLFNIHFVAGVGKIVGIRRNGDILVVAAQNWELCSMNLGHRPTKTLSSIDHFPTKNLNIHGAQSSFYMETFMDCLVICKKVNGVPTMSINYASTTSQQALFVGTSGVRITGKGKEEEDKAS